MADRPIPFSAPMVRALIDGRKTQTRRILNGVPEWCGTDRKPGYSCLTPAGHIEFRGHYPGDAEVDAGYGSKFVKLPYLKGDRLYVREEYYQRGHWEPVEGAVTKKGRQKWAFTPADDVILFDPPAEHRKGRRQADPGTVAWHKRLGRFMPRIASRMTLTVTGVRVERLQDCSEADAKAEGCDRAPIIMRNDYLSPPETYQAGYRALWDSINGAGAWEENPWVVAVTFTVEQRNIDRG